MVPGHPQYRTLSRAELGFSLRLAACNVIAFVANKLAAQIRGPAFFRQDPRAALPGRIMPDMPGMAAVEIGNPMSRLVLMKTYDPTLHSYASPHQERRAHRRAAFLL